jgi:hypothetical protein
MSNSGFGTSQRALGAYLLIVGTRFAISLWNGQ